MSGENLSDFFSCYDKYRAAIVELVQVVLELVGDLAGELSALLIANGCAKSILGLNLGGLINGLLDVLGLGGLGLGGLLGNL